MVFFYLDHARTHQPTSDRNVRRRSGSPMVSLPFLRHSFKVERPAQIEKLLRAGVKTVTIDLDRGSALTLSKIRQTDNPDTPHPGDSGQKPIKTLAQLNEEYAQAALAKQQLTQSVQTVFTRIASTGTVNAQQAADAVHEITIVTRTLTPHPSSWP